MKQGAEITRMNENPPRILKEAKFNCSCHTPCDTPWTGTEQSRHGVEFFRSTDRIFIYFLFAAFSVPTLGQERAPGACNNKHKQTQTRYHSCPFIVLFSLLGLKRLSLLVPATY
ncbi:hypothetical protein AAFF_G00383310 [Aldrovandia affinis]|uniref:Uncharacterized protein n=1 Tax=Aldrovandia affinis TaxID=143900 RepID=A0AAD7X1T4_9TELE|nr:hypothetical protein AAFF_G00383310 [Aldrovandia affinis]